MSRRRTVQGSVFLAVSLLLVCVLVGFSLVVYDYASGVARERFAEALNTLSRSVMTNLDAQVAEMNRLSLTIIYSQVFQGLFARHLALPRNPGDGGAEDRQAGEHGGADRDQRDDPGPQPLRAAGQRLRSSGRDDRRRLLQPPHRAGRETRTVVRGGHGGGRRPRDPSPAHGSAAGADVDHRQGQALLVAA